MRADLVENKPNGWARLADILIILGAIGLGSYVAQNDFESVVPLILSLSGFIIVRFALKRPFHEAFTLYIAIAAFNYYYFYCSKLTGRNPTDVPGSIGLPATDLENLQKDIVFGLLLLLAGIKLFIGRIQGKEMWLKRTDHALLQMVILLAGYSILRSFFIVLEGDTPFNAIYYLRINIEYALIPFLLLTSLISNEKQLRVMYGGLLYTLPLVALLGIIEFFIHGSPYERSFSGGQLLSRATSTLQNPNNLGGYLGTTMGIYILYFIKQKLSNMERLLFWPTIPLAMICLLMTMSRSSLLSFFVALAICLVILLVSSKKRLGKDKYKYYKKMMTYFVIIGSLCMFVTWRYFGLSSAVIDAFEMYLSEDAALRNVRVFALLPTIKAMLSNPLGAFFGYSKESFHFAVDNGYATVLIRSGVIGFALYMSVWIMAFKTCIKRITDKEREHNFLYLICFYTLLYQAIYAFSTPIHQNFPHNMYYWFTIGVIIWLESAFIRPGAQAQAEEEALQDAKNT